MIRSPFRFLCNQDYLKHSMVTKHDWLEYSIKKTFQHKGFESDIHFVNKTKILLKNLKNRIIFTLLKINFLLNYI